MDGKSAEDVGSMADEELIATYLESHDRRAFEVLVRRHQDTVYAMCVRILGAPALAEEVAQDVFVAVYRNLERFRGDAKFSTWLYRVTVNHCKNKQAYRARRFAKRHESLQQTRETADGGEVARELPDPGPDPEDEAVADERRHILERGLAELGEEQRTIIVMRDLQGLAYDEIAAVLDLAEGTVKSRLHRARAALKRAVGKLLMTAEEAPQEG